MHIFTTAAALRTFTEQTRAAGRRLGLVPTMGALHEGHLQLVRAAGQECDVVVASIFVNPTQFTNADDFRLYPRLPEADTPLLAAANCTALFLPSAAEMYPAPTGLRFDFGPLERVMEGAHRPGHFHGVATVVSKLFHLARPHRAYFGQKDWPTGSLCPRATAASALKPAPWHRSSTRCCGRRLSASSRGCRPNRCRPRH